MEFAFKITTVLIDNTLFLENAMMLLQIVKISKNLEDYVILVTADMNFELIQTVLKHVFKKLQFVDLINI